MVGYQNFGFGIRYIENKATALHELACVIRKEVACDVNKWTPMMIKILTNT